MGTFLLYSNYLFYIFSEISFKFSSAIKVCSSSFFHFFYHFLSPLTQILWKQALKNTLKKSVLKVSHVYTSPNLLVSQGYVLLWEFPNLLVSQGYLVLWEFRDLLVSQG